MNWLVWLYVVAFGVLFLSAAVGLCTNGAGVELL